MFEDILDNKRRWFIKDIKSYNKWNFARIFIWNILKYVKFEIKYWNWNPELKINKLSHIMAKKMPGKSSVRSDDFVQFEWRFDFKNSIYVQFGMAYIFMIVVENLK